MSAALMERNQSSVTPPVISLGGLFPECKFTPVSLEIPPGMKFERWQELGDFLRLLAKGIQFFVGDWIRYGEHEYGEMYSQAIEVTGREAATLQNWVYVAENVESSRRRELDRVSFSIHAEVASLPAAEQERILAKAEQDEEITVLEVRRQVKKAKHKLNKRPSELEFIHTPEAQAYLDKCEKALFDLIPSIPANVPSLRILNRQQREQIAWQKNRTVEGDCAAILELFVGESQGSRKGIPYLYEATDSEIYWALYKVGRHIDDPDLDDRLELMSLHSSLEQEISRANHKLRMEGHADKLLPAHKLSCDCKAANKQLAIVDQGGKQDERRGDQPDLYMLYGQTTGDSANVSRARSNYDSGERE